MGEAAGEGSITPSLRSSAVRVTARSFHSERQGLATSVQGNENICAEVAVYSPASSPELTSRRDMLLGVQGFKITNGDLLAWL